MVERHWVDVHILLIRGERVLLSRRRDTDPEFDGLWHAPSGKLEPAESVIDAAAREALEEVGVEINDDDLRLVHTCHVRDEHRDARLGLFFATTRWRGEPVNREPAKCSEISWFPLTALPADLIGYSAMGLRGYTTGERLSLLGWA